MRSFQLLALHLCLFSEASAQSFNERYDFRQFLNGNAFWDVEIMENQYVLFGGADDSLGDYVGISFTTLNFHGNVLNEKAIFKDSTYLYAGWANSTSLLSDGSYIMGGGYNDGLAHSYLVKFDSEGDTLWTKVIGNEGSFITGRCAIPSSDGGFLLVGPVEIDTQVTSCLIKTDSNGNEEWRRFYGSDIGTNSFVTITALPSDEYLLGGKFTSFGIGQNTDTWVVKVDSEGDEIWQHTYGDQGFDDGLAHVLANDDGTAVIAAASSLDDMVDEIYSFPYITKIDSNGDIIWENTYGSYYLNTGLISIKHVPEGGYISAGASAESDLAYEGLLIRIAENGDSLWMRRYNWMEGNSCYFRDVIPSENGGFVAVGDVYPVNDLDLSFDGWVVKTDEFGCVVPGCHLAIEEKNATAEISLFPNPTSTMTNVYIKSRDPGLHGEILISDITGKIIQSQKTIGGDINIGLDVSMFHSGVYLVQLMAEGKTIATKKLVVE
jgi:hypothetical protein